MNNIRIVIITLLVLFSAIGISFGSATTAPEIRNQGQTTLGIHPGESITLYAQGKDDSALDWAWLATNETGVWQNFKGWRNFDWGYCKQIRIDHTKVQGNLVNFPVLVSIVDSDLHENAQSDFDDIVFVDASNTTKFNHEIEYFNSTSGELVAWVNIPLLSSLEDTVFYMYYGNPTCTNQQNVQGTWDANYLIVHHLTGASSSALHDSTTNHWDVTRAFGNPGYNYPGKIGKSVDLDPAVAWDSFRIGGFYFSTGSSYTGSAWMYVDGSQTNVRYVFEGNNSRGISLVVNSDKKVYVLANTNNGLRSTHGETIVDNANPQWIYVCTRADTLANRLDVFVNGVSENHTALNGAIDSVDYGLNLGASQTNTSRMNGRIDELRISNVERSDSWIKTEFTMMSLPQSFLTISTEFTPGESTRYGSPMKMQENSQWQWSNFSWQNPIIPQGTVIGWRLTYQDTEGNTNQTDIMRFTILGSPPAVPQAPSGPTTGTIGQSYGFSLLTTDPDEDAVAFLVDWGDGNLSDWTAFVPSGTSTSVSHIWQAEGTYTITVKAKDTFGALTSWSSSATIVITAAPLPQLILTAPLSVVEGTSFEVSVTLAGLPVDHALVSLEETTLFTNSAGTVTLVAPQVQVTRAIALSAEHAGYQSAIMTIMVLDSGEPGSENGWVYGLVANTTGGYLKNAQVCVLLVGNNATSLCAFTDTQGRYNFRVSPGSYTVKASKYSYTTTSKTNVIVQQNHAIEVNFILLTITEEKPIPPYNENRDLVEAVIAAGIATKKIAGELNVEPAMQNYSLTMYEEAISASLVSMNLSWVIVRISATGIPGTIFVVRLYGQNNVTDVAVAVDGEPITQVRFSQIFDIEDSEPVYARVIDTSGGKTIIYCLVYLPHFSQHEISIKTMMETVQAFGGMIAVTVYIIIAVILMVVLVVPIVMIERKRP